MDKYQNFVKRIYEITREYLDDEDYMVWLNNKPVNDIIIDDFDYEYITFKFGVEEQVCEIKTYYNKNNSKFNTEPTFEDLYEEFESLRYEQIETIVVSQKKFTKEDLE